MPDKSVILSTLGVTGKPGVGAPRNVDIRLEGACLIAIGIASFKACLAWLVANLPPTLPYIPPPGARPAVAAAFKPATPALPKIPSLKSSLASSISLKDCCPYTVPLES